MTPALIADGAAQFSSGSHTQTVPPPSTGARQLFFNIGSLPAIIMTDTVGGISTGSSNTFGTFPIISSSHFRVNGLPIASVGKASAPPGFGPAFSAGSNIHFMV